MSVAGLVILRGVCWAYLILIFLGRIANFNCGKTNSLIARAIDDIMFIMLVVFLYFLR